MADRETLVERPWRCDVTGNPVDTDTRMIGAPPCDCQGCRAASELSRLKAKVEEQAATITQLQKWIDLHRGDTLSLENEFETMRRHWLGEEARCTDLSARLARAVEVMRRVNPALSAAFQGGMEEREGGSANRQARYMESVDQLRADARAFLSEQENPHG